MTERFAIRRQLISPGYLLPCAPEHNPDEYLNRDLKRPLHSGLIARTVLALTEKAKRW